MATVASNTKHIQENRAKIFALENQVMFNRAQAYAARSLVNENSALINKNYQAAFIGNRQLANQNTDDLFRNRTAIVRNIRANSQVETNFKEAVANKTKLEFLDHRAKLNERVLKVTEELAAINKQLINVNRDIMDTNENIATFNKKAIADNAKLLAEGVNASAATPESNADIISQNHAKIAEILKRSDANKGRISTLLETANRNRTSILANSESILERRERILANHRKIAENQDKVRAFISKL